jgi:hypothetical protein
MTTITNRIGRENIMYFPRNFGVSLGAAKIRKESDEIKQRFARTESFGEHLSQTLEALLIAKRKYSVENWDGYGASSISEQSFQNSLRFALSLPSNIPTPDVDVIPSGQVVFNWYKGRRQLFSIIIGNRNEMSYAGLFGATKIYGVEYFNENIPEIILDNICKVYSS